MTDHDHIKGPFTVIDHAIGEWRMAEIGDDGLPTRVRFFLDNEIDPVGLITRGRVHKIDKRNDLAFVTLANGGDGVLNFRRARLLKKGRVDSIAECVHEGEKLTVQIVADYGEQSQKALSVSPRLRLVGRYVVVESGEKRVSASHDLPASLSHDLKGRLSLLSEHHIILVRSNAAHAPVETTVKEAETLLKLLTDTNNSVCALDPLQQLCAAIPASTEPVYIVGAGNYNIVRKAATIFYPDLLKRLSPYKQDSDPFEDYGVTEAMEEALSGRIMLPCGGWISIHPTPALTAIDVNMGTALQGRRANEAKLQVNMEAALAIAFHLRFQNIGGLVVIDFIDMTAKGAVADLTRVLDEALADDDVPISRGGISGFGLMELNRKRSGQSLGQRFVQTSEPRPTPQAKALSLLRQAAQTGMTAGAGKIIIACDAETQQWLHTRTGLIRLLQQQTSRDVEVKVSSAELVYLED